jgi:uncharacterized coiled-coil protein SlyX
VIVITTFLALLAVSGGLLWLGYTVRTPAEVAEARALVATLASRQEVLETSVVELAEWDDEQRETLDDLSGEIAAMQGVRAELEDELRTSAQQNATLVAEARLSRDQVLAFATAEAGRAALLQELERRSARVERFLQRLSDISADTALDLEQATPVAPVLPVTPSPAPPTPTRTPATLPPTPTRTLATLPPTDTLPTDTPPTATLASTSTPDATGTPDEVATSTPAATSTRTATGALTPSPSVTPTP